MLQSSNKYIIFVLSDGIIVALCLVLALVFYEIFPFIVLRKSGIGRHLYKRQKKTQEIMNATHENVMFYCLRINKQRAKSERKEHSGFLLFLQ